MLPRFSLAITIIVLVTIAAVFGKRSDADTLAALGKVLATKARTGLPDHRPFAGPLTALKPSDRFPLEERVRARIQNDKLLIDANVEVMAGDQPGEVQLRGLAPTLAAKMRAIELAVETIGVETVVANALAVP